MALSTCGSDPRSGSIFFLITGIILTLVSPFVVSLMNDYFIVKNKRVVLKFDVIPLCLMIISCIVHLMTLYGVIKRKASWIISYLIYGGFIFVIFGYLLAVILNETLKSQSLSKKILILYWCLNFSFCLFSYVFIHTYYKQLKNEKKKQIAESILVEQTTFSYEKLTV